MKISAGKKQRIKPFQWSFYKKKNKNGQHQRLKNVLKGAAQLFKKENMMHKMS